MTTKAESAAYNSLWTGMPSAWQTNLSGLETQILHILLNKEYIISFKYRDGPKSPKEN